MWTYHFRLFLSCLGVSYRWIFLTIRIFQQIRYFWERRLRKRRCGFLCVLNSYDDCKEQNTFGLWKQRFENCKKVTFSWEFWCPPEKNPNLSILKFVLEFSLYIIVQWWFYFSDFSAFLSEVYIVQAPAAVFKAVRFHTGSLCSQFCFKYKSGFWVGKIYPIYQKMAII